MAGQEGHYNVTVADMNGVSPPMPSSWDHTTACPLYLPNTLTPNGDGINDVLHVAMDCS
ncbi:MAG: hypothetical protein IPL64_04405 [Flavobacteriales bacterium]|nr:hypothetical protein [Flavobacteriales bacterium]